MKFSTRARYGLRAMLELAMNYKTRKPLPLYLIAQRQGVSEGYLEQMMTYLRKGGLIRSVRGPQGGYLLARAPDKITAGEIVRLLEGSLSPTAGQCVTQVLWRRVRESVAEVLDNTTLEDLCKEEEGIAAEKR